MSRARETVADEFELLKAEKMPLGIVHTPFLNEKIERPARDNLTITDSEKIVNTEELLKTEKMPPGNFDTLLLNEEIEPHAGGKVNITEDGENVKGEGGVSGARGALVLRSFFGAPLPLREVSSVF